MAEDDLLLRLGDGEVLDDVFIIREIGLESVIIGFVGYDENNQEITVNNNFFEYQIPPWSINITGTGYEVADSGVDGASIWMRNGPSPVTLTS